MTLKEMLCTALFLKETGEYRNRENLTKRLINKFLTKLDLLLKLKFSLTGLPKTRSGKIMRRILRKIAEGDYSNFGTSLLY
jgi:acetyl-CoA synthetase